MTDPSSPARRVIEKFATDKRSGEYVLARALGCSVATVYRWDYPRARGGTDGRIPARWQTEILRAAAELGIKLTPADLVDCRGVDAA
jgi:hypothetical protein